MNIQEDLQLNQRKNYYLIKKNKEYAHEKYTLLKKKYLVCMLEKVEWYKDVKESEKYEYQDLDEESIDLRLKIPSFD